MTTTLVLAGQVRNSDKVGVLQLTVEANGFDWQLVPGVWQDFTDTGSDHWH